MPREQLYNSTMYILCGMLVIGLIFNALVRPVNSKWFMSQEDVAKLQAERNAALIVAGSHGTGKGGLDLQAALFWAFVGIPLGWGVWKTLVSTAKIF